MSSLRLALKLSRVDTNKESPEEKKDDSATPIKRKRGRPKKPPCARGNPATIRHGNTNPRRLEMTNQAPGSPIKRKRGRPRKYPLGASISNNSDGPPISNNSDGPPIKRKRGRPRKHPDAASIGTYAGVAGANKSSPGTEYNSHNSGPPVKWKRGRPRKHPPEASIGSDKGVPFASNSSSCARNKDHNSRPPIKRKRGRPRKHPVDESLRSDTGGPGANNDSSTDAGNDGHLCTPQKQRQGLSTMNRDILESRKRKNQTMRTNGENSCRGSLLGRIEESVEMPKSRLADQSLQNCRDYDQADVCDGSSIHVAKLEGDRNDCAGEQGQSNSIGKRNPQRQRRPPKLFVATPSNDEVAGIESDTELHSGLEGQRQSDRIGQRNPQRQRRPPKLFVASPWNDKVVDIESDTELHRGDIAYQDIVEQRKSISVGQKVKTLYNYEYKRNGQHLMMKKWYKGTVVEVLSGGSQIRVKYNDGDEAVEEFPSEGIVLDGDIILSENEDDELPGENNLLELNYDEENGKEPLLNEKVSTEMPVDVRSIVGQRVKGLWQCECQQKGRSRPRKEALWYEGTVVKLLARGSKIRILYDDGDYEDAEFPSKRIVLLGDVAVEKERDMGKSDRQQEPLCKHKKRRCSTKSEPSNSRTESAGTQGKVSSALSRAAIATEHPPQKSLPLRKRKIRELETADRIESAEKRVPSIPVSYPNNQIVHSSSESTFWRTMYERLRAYADEHGNCLVPIDYEDDPRLARWVNDQRNRKGKLSKHRRNQLDNIGFSWIVMQMNWEVSFQALANFRKLHGHCRVPYRYTEKWLGRWVSFQRKLRRQNQLSSDQVARLSGIDFVWEPRDVPPLLTHTESKESESLCPQKETMNGSKNTAGDSHVEVPWDCVSSAKETFGSNDAPNDRGAGFPSDCTFTAEEDKLVLKFVVKSGPAGSCNGDIGEQMRLLAKYSPEEVYERAKILREQEPVVRSAGHRVEKAVLSQDCTSLSTEETRSVPPEDEQKEFEVVV